MKNNEFLPLSRSYRFEGSQYFVEASFPLLDTDEIMNTYHDPDTFWMFKLILNHENYHALVRNLGDTANRLLNSYDVIAEIFNETSDKIDLDLIIKLELSNLILHKRSEPLQEALSVYTMYIFEERFLTDSNKHFEIWIEDECSKLPEKNKEILYNILALKKVILSDKNVKTIYDDLLWMHETFDNYRFPISIVQYSLDLRYNLSPDLIISNDPRADVRWRFDMILDSLKNLEKKGMLGRVPRPSLYEYSDKKTNYTELKLESFLHELTGLETSWMNISVMGKDEHVEKMQFVPDKNVHYYRKFNLLPIFKPYDSIEDSEEAKNRKDLFGNIIEHNIWAGLKINGKTRLVPNVKFVPSEILEYWIKHFWSWFLKECIIADEDIDVKITEISQIREPNKSKMYQKAKALQDTLDFEKADDYSDFIKIRKQNLKLN